MHETLHDPTQGEGADLAALPRRPRWPAALWRGLTMRCPACGERSAFQGYLHVRDVCDRCGTPLGRFPSDDAPIYVTLVVVLHIVITALVLVDRGGTVPSLTLLEIFLPMTAVLTFALLRPIKGATLAVLVKVGFQRGMPPVPGANQAGS